MRIEADVLPDPWAYRHAALAATYQDVVTPGGVFQGLAEPPQPDFAEWLQGHGLTVTRTCLRRSPRGQVEPHYLHTDTDMGEWMAILYLTPAPPRGDGTVFWMQDGRISGPAGEYAEHPVRAGYLPYLVVRAVWNGAVLFPANRLHSRALYDNYGEGADARLIQIAWGTGQIGQG